MNPTNSSTERPAMTPPDAPDHAEAARRQGERADERRGGERRDDHDEEHDPDFARGEDRRAS